MLKLDNIVKEYQSGDTVVKALKGISLNFRNSEFVSILGQSGCGKTTLLNIIGGLDRYTSGELFIDNISTKKYKDKNWDTYRNNKIGFVFQNYNLIPHQTVLANVELALTLSGVSKSERKKRAIEVLEQVGLGDQIYKKPNQMSGGQMQRVAIARALINNPEIVLADEPTGALDSATSVQIMEILKKISEDKLIIMVTHNPDLAEKYSSRIINLLDGKVIDDSDPFSNEENDKIQNELDQKNSDTDEKPVTKDAANKKENDAVNKKADKKNKKVKEKKMKKKSMSFMTALSLSLNNLMTKKTRTFLTSFAGSIGIIGIALILSLSSGMQAYIHSVEQDTLSNYPITIEKTSVDYGTLFGSEDKKDKAKHEDGKLYSDNNMSRMMNTMLSSMSVNDLSSFKKYMDSSESEINKLANDVQYGYDIDVKIYQPDTENGIERVNPQAVLEKLGFQTNENQMSMSFGGNQNVWSEMIDNEKLIKSQFKILAGHLPESYDEIVLVANEDGTIDEFALYSLGLLDTSELEDIFKNLNSGKLIKKMISKNDVTYTYDDLLNKKFKMVLNSDCYQEENGVVVDKSKDDTYMKNIIDQGVDIKIAGILQKDDDANSASISTTIGYTKDLINYLMEKNNNSDIVNKQKENSNVDVLTGQAFTDNSYEENLKSFGSADPDNPSSINIYAKDFSSKEKIQDIIDDYNANMKKDGKDDSVIKYTDFVGLMMSSVSDIINAITYVLIAFVAISLVVSSIMIGIITYISVLERTKEIGILRSIGASKRDISRVFNAETVIVGFVAGVLGIGITILLNIPVNIIIKNISGVSGVSKLPVAGAVILILISILLTFIAGLIPAKVASKKDPVVALRTE